MAKTIIINLDSLIDVKVTENVNVIAANAASATATAKAGEAATSADVAELHKIAAANSVMAAGVNADAASVSAGVSTTQAGIATVQAGLAITAKTATDALYAASLDVLAQTSKLYDDFDDRYLWGHSSDPIVDNDGNAILDGALYWNTISKEIKVYSQTSNAWIALKDIGGGGALLTANNLADISNTSTARTNLDVYSKAETTAEAVAQIELQKGVANGIAELDVNGLVPSAQLPSYVDDVVEVATKAALPVTGESGKIYVVVADETSNDDTSSYRWTGTVYAMISNTLTAADVKALYESNLDTNAYTDAEQVKIGYITVTQAVDLDTIESDTSLNNTHRTSNGTDHTYIDQDVTTIAIPTFAGIITTGLVDGRDVSVDGLKLDGIEAGAQVNVATDLTVTAGTTAGPTINSSTGAAVVIPSASGTASGVITTGAQTIAGVKTLTNANLVTPVIGVASGTSLTLTGGASATLNVNGINVLNEIKMMQFALIGV